MPVGRTQEGFDVRFEWGPAGVDALADCATFVVVDVLSFSTSVSIVAERGGLTIPCPARDDAAALARTHDAEIAGARGSARSLSPASLETFPSGARLVLASLNGAAVTLAAASHGGVLAGCLRNRSAVARAAGAFPVAVIAAGERWPDGSLRPSIEDLLGAGAILSRLPGTRSPEAMVAIETFESAAASLPAMLHACTSGRELVDRGFARDVDLAAALDVTTTVPVLRGGMFTAR